MTYLLGVTTMKSFLLAIALMFTSLSYAKPNNPTAIINTNKGSIHLELFKDKAPKTVDNFISYAKSGHYKGTIFHRVISNFMIQGGGYTTNLKEKTTKKPIKNEARADVSNAIGTIAMARTGEPHSATAQFFINVNDNTFLNFKSPTKRGYGYAVFGKVTKGMTVVNRIKKVATKANGPHQNLPIENIIIKDVVIK